MNPRNLVRLALGALLPALLPAWASSPAPLRLPAPLPVAPSRAAEPPPAPVVGRFTRRGAYVRPRQVRRFLRLHGIEDVPRYPVVLHHGLFGYRNLDLGPVIIPYYLGVEQYLRRHGVEVFLPETTPFASFEQRARELKEQVLATGWEKFHIIAHSAGGLDSRYMITHLGMADRVVSLTTVSTPHRGTWYADFALKWVFEKQRMWKVWDLFGLHREGIHEISVAGMKEFNARTPDMPGVRYYSFGGVAPFYTTTPPLTTVNLILSAAEKAAVGERPNLRERVMARFALPKAVRRRLSRDPKGLIRELLGEEPPAWVRPDQAGQNDGLVTVSSARWGEYLGDLDADHLDEMGWLSFFPARRFYRNICRYLYDQGM